MAEDLKTEGTAEDGALTVQVAETADGPAPSAQAAGPDAVAAVTLAAGTPLVQEVRPGQAIDIRGADATAMSLRQEGEALILDFGAAGAVELTGYFTAVEAGAPPVVTLDGNIQLPIGQLIAAVTQTDDLLEPAAGPAAGPGIPGGGANFTPTEIRSIGDGIDITDLLPPTGLQFSVPDPDPAPLLLGGEDLASTDPLPSTTIPGPNPPEPTPPPGAGDVAGTVQEAALADGSGGPGATTLTGTLPVTNGTISAIAFGGKVTEAAADGTITVENGLFRLVVDSTTGEYTFTLLDNTLDHDNTGAVGA
ncbi:MAG TPA: hypothetical protein VFO41_09135, partial [Alphaproteobacteria bacterium]|nr:hypothetical protein [Alphaproteobacteria bacterium]